MSRKTLAIVSSYNELCGNAVYTKALSRALQEHFDVTVVPLNTDLLRKKDSDAAHSHIKKVCQELQAYDCVNIQFEAGLFGLNHKTITKRFYKIADSCKKLLLTMHRVDYKVQYPGCFSLAKNILKGNIRDTSRQLQIALVNNRCASIYNKIILYCKNRKTPIIVHSKREREDARLNFNYELVFDHPLCFYEQNYIQSLIKDYDRDTFCKDYSLSPQNTYLGILGFISQYKGYETILRALAFLPEKYHLIIFGKQHPHTIQAHEPVNTYIKSLMEEILKLKIEKRVKFFGISNDDDFLKALMGCDFNLLPYLEVNQGGSGIAALSLETNSKAIFSQNKAFLELEKYAPNSFPMFSIGNYLELANLIQNYPHSRFQDGLQKYHQNYNPKTSALLYNKLLTEI